MTSLLAVANIWLQFLFCVIVIGCVTKRVVREAGCDVLVVWADK